VRDSDSLAETRTRSGTALHAPGHTAGEARAEPWGRTRAG